MRRITALFLAFVTVLLLIPSAGAAEAEDLHTIVEKQALAFADSLAQPNAHEEAISQLLNQAMNGRGKAISYGAKDAVTASVFSSNLFREFLVEALVAGADNAAKQQLDKILVGTASLAWRDYDLLYAVSQYEYSDNATLKDDKAINRFRTTGPCSSGPNQHDKAMILVVGGARCAINMIRTAGNMDTLSYKVHITVMDYFDFEGDYSDAEEMGYNTSLTELICFVGKMLDHGIFDEFDWSSHVSFDLTVPNYCTHTSGNYRWEGENQHLESVSGEGLTYNALERIQSKKTDGTMNDPYFQADIPVILRHDRPWTVEFKSIGTGIFVMSPTNLFLSSDLPYLLKSFDHVVGGYPYADTYIDEDTGNEVKTRSRNQYGVKLSNIGYKSNVYHTYRIENRIHEDGSNMPWLYIDDVEAGPMNGHWQNIKSVNYDVEGVYDWFNGLDLTINYIFNGQARYTDRITVDYIEIWENGKGAEPFSYITEKTVKPTCESAGYIERTCSLCNVTVRENKIPETGHQYKLTDESKPGCETEGGKTYTCEKCGDRYTDKIDATGHNYTDKTTPPTCTANGYTEHLCSTCGHSYQDAQTPATGHTPGKETEENRVEPTATEEGGYDLVTRCEECGEELQRTHHVLEATGLTGDVNGDGTINNMDAMMVLQHFVGIIQLPEPQLCDVNCSGNVDNIDAMLILQFFVGIIDTFPTV